VWWNTCTFTIGEGNGAALKTTSACTGCCCLQEREAAQRAAELASRALAAEKRLVEAMKDEAAASAELLEAERAAKFAAQVGTHTPCDAQHCLLAASVVMQKQLRACLWRVMTFACSIATEL
jgi:hypothetical protein